MHRSLLGMQADLNDILCLQRRDSIFATPFAGSIKSRKAFKELCGKLYQIGVRGDTIIRKETQVLDLFRRGSMALNRAFDIEGPSQTANDYVTTALTTLTDTSLSSSAIKFGIFCFFLGILLAGTWVAGFLLESFTRLT